MKKKYFYIILLILSILQTSFFISYVSAEENVDISFSLKWEIRSNSYNYYSASFFDYNKDGKLNPVLGTSDGVVILNHKGSLLKNVKIDYNRRTPVITDLENDGTLELITSEYFGLSILDSSGNIVNYTFISFNEYSYTKPLVIDVNNDGIQEILFSTLTNLYCYSANFILLWSYHFTDSPVYQNGDIFAINADSDSNKEIALFDGTNLYVVDDDGTLKWSSDELYYSVVATDFNNDGIDEIIAIKSVNKEILSMNSKDGTILWSYESEANYNPLPIDLDGDYTDEVLVLSTSEEKQESYIILLDGITGEIKSQTKTDSPFNSYYTDYYLPQFPVVGDLNGDGIFEIAFTSSYSYYNRETSIFSTNGILVKSFDFAGYTTPTFVDLDRDGRTEILLSDFSSLLCYEVTDVTSGKNIWYKDGGNIANTKVKDTDGDLLDDLSEEFFGSDIKNNDTDGDTLVDGIEIIGSSSSPLKIDTDEDTFEDPFEYEVGLNPRIDDLTLDYDGDTLTNYDEVIIYGTSPLNNDTDGDLVSDNEEINTYGTSPLDVDTDDDGLEDGEEIIDYSSDPLKNDTDSDGMNDGYEALYGLNLLLNDSFDDKDADGLLNLEEYLLNSNSSNVDSDGDTILDGDEVHVYNTSPVNNDSDSDWLLDNEEINIYGTNPANNDTDSDLMSDGWEIIYQLDPLQNDGSEDLDSDGLVNADEFKYNSKPNETDSDGDLLLDGDEVHIYGSSPINQDTDEDKVNDYEEVITYNTNPLSNDTDSDLLTDYYEITYGLNPLINDSFEDLDNDSLSNYEEFLLGTLPNNNDTDSDGMSDGFEYYYGLILTDNDALLDIDNDGLSNLGEFQLGTSPINNDTDSDKMLDGFEAQYGLNPLLNDSYEDNDADGIVNLDEMNYGSSPISADTDNDQLTDPEEIFIYHSLPSVPDSDGDGIDDGEEVLVYGTSPTNTDTDGDSLNDYAELFVFLTDPLKADSDGDGMSDADEIAIGKNPLKKNYYTPLSKFLFALPIIGGFVALTLSIIGIYILYGKFKQRKQKEIIEKEILLLKSEHRNLDDRISILQKKNFIFADKLSFRSLLDITKLYFNFISKFDEKYAMIKKFKEVTNIQEWEKLEESLSVSFEKLLNRIKQDLESFSLDSLIEQQFPSLKGLTENSNLDNKQIMLLHSDAKTLIQTLEEHKRYFKILLRRINALDSLFIMKDKLFAIVSSTSIITTLKAKDKEFTTLSKEKIISLKDLIQSYNPCPNCGTTIPDNSSTCPNCKKTLLTCPICKKELHLFDYVYTCPECSALIHSDELELWLKDTGTCPKCNKSIVLIDLEVDIL